MAEAGFRWRDFLGEATRLAALTFAGYVIAWFYEMGYALYFRIPLDLIRIEVPDIAIACMSVVGLGFVVTFTLWLWRRLAASGRPVRAWVGRAVLILVIPGAMLAAFGCTRGNIASNVVGSAILLGAATRPRLMNSFAQSATRPRVLLAIFALAAVAAVIFAFDIGTSIAARKASFPVEIVQGHEYAVLSVYGDTVVAAPFDRKSREVQPTFAVRKLEATPTVVRLEEVGPLIVRHNLWWRLLLFGIS